jgi:acyl carrier protein
MKEIRDALKILICEALHLEDVTPQEISDDGPLFGEGLGLDSVDALELAMEIENRFGVRISRDPDDTRAFASVNALAQFLVDAGVDEKKVKSVE